MVIHDIDLFLIILMPRNERLILWNLQIDNLLILFEYLILNLIRTNWQFLIFPGAGNVERTRGGRFWGSHERRPESYFCRLNGKQFSGSMAWASGILEIIASYCIQPKFLNLQANSFNSDVRAFPNFYSARSKSYLIYTVIDISMFEFGGEPYHFTASLYTTKHW